MAYYVQEHDVTYEYKMVWENSENVDYFYPVNQNYLPYQYTQIEKQ
jgi:hypothetical protein